MSGVLIVDDHASIRHLLRVIVERETPFEVCGEAENGAEAVLAAHHLEPEIVLLDLAMPFLNGAEAAPMIRHLLPHTRIVLFTFHGNEVSKILEGQLHVDLVLSKPEGLAKLPDYMIALAPRVTGAPPGAIA